MTIVDPLHTSRAEARPVGHLGSLARFVRCRTLRAAAVVRDLFGALFLASLNRRIISLNLLALAVLVGGILYLNHWRAGLIEARLQSLHVQGEIIAAAVAASAKVDSDIITLDPERLIDLDWRSPAPAPFNPALEFPINPEAIAPLLRNLVLPTRTRARLYDDGGFLVVDSAAMYARGEVQRTEVAAPPPLDGWTTLFALLPGDDLPRYYEFPANEGKRYPEVLAALAGTPQEVVRVDESHRLVVSVAVPVRRPNLVIGALLLSTIPGDIDAVVASDHWAILRMALVAALVAVVLSVLLARTIAGPLRRLAAAADQMQIARSPREEIPDFSNRRDEVGDLSRALRGMTCALYTRIEAIERFAADVAHELKNPLTSLRSAVETLPRARRDGDSERLLAIIHHDVRRLDRLISDISNASRLDAELARDDMALVDLDRLLATLVAIEREPPGTIAITLQRDAGSVASTMLLGHEGRLAQVFNNLIDNAVSFSPPGGAIIVAVRVRDDRLTVTITDDGPGIRGDIGKIFQRFYTDRPEGESFGDHSGLGLAIARQIVEVHRGTISAANRTDRTGAVFTVSLPRAAKALPARADTGFSVRKRKTKT